MKNDGQDDCKLCRMAAFNYFHALLEITDTAGFLAVLPSRL